MEKQLSFDNKIFKKVPSKFGGDYLKKSHAKTKRPVTTKSAMHITLRSAMAIGEYSFLSKDKIIKIRNVINKQAERFDIKLYNFSINSKHIHLLIKLQYRDSYNKFIKAITSIIARMTIGAQKGHARLAEMLKSFWDSRPFSRIVSWGRDYFNTFYYVFENDLEAGGFIKYRNRNKFKTSTA